MDPAQAPVWSAQPQGNAIPEKVTKPDFPKYVSCDVFFSSDYLAKVPFDVALAAVGGDDQQEEQGRSQHHLVEGGGSLKFTAV